MKKKAITLHLSKTQLLVIKEALDCLTDQFYPTQKTREESDELIERIGSEYQKLSDKIKKTEVYFDKEDDSHKDFEWANENY